MSITTESHHTSVLRRIEAHCGKPDCDQWLAPLEINEQETGAVVSSNRRRASDKGCLPISVADYIALVDWTGRTLASGKRGAIPARLAPILIRTGIAASRWVQVAGRFGCYFHRVAGRWRSVSSEHPHSNHAARFHPGRADLLDAA